MPPAPLQTDLMVVDLLDDFETVHGRAAEVVARAPGRVNLIGEHTDYNLGRVLPLAIDRRTVVCGARRDDRRVRVVSREMSPDPVAPGALQEFDLDRSPLESTWVGHVQAAFQAAARHRGESLGVAGMDLAIASDVPRESGLSSSAALGVALVTAIDAAERLGLSGVERARVAQHAESEILGVGCGLMDHLASSLGRAGHALRIDCGNLEVRTVPLPVDRVRLLVADSGVRRVLAPGGGGVAYGDRRAECEAALVAARACTGRELASLSDLEPADLPRLREALDPLAFRRARHVVTENERVDRTCAALEHDDYEVAGALLREGMASLRSDFEVSTPELDALCELADEEPDVYGSRLTGAGFGGCTIHLVAADAAPELAARLAAGFQQRFDRRPPVFEIVPTDGAEVLL